MMTYFCFWLHQFFVSDQGLSLAKEVGLLFLAACGLLVGVASLVANMGSSLLVQQLWHMGLVVLWPVGSSQTRDQSRGPCTGRGILNH